MEKYDGIRAMWEGPRGGFRTRGGDLNKQLYRPPPSLARLLPADMRLDGELWAKRGDFEAAAMFRRVNPASGHAYFEGDHETNWASIIFKVYDAPSSASRPFLERLAAARAALPPSSPRVHVVQATRCEDEVTARALCARVESFGGEGLVLRRVDARWRPGRTRDVLKIKSFFDSEARVQQRVGAGGRESVWVSSIENGTLFKIATSRHNVSAGSVITYKYCGLVHSDGGPRFPSILRVHGEDCVCEACCVSRENRWPTSIDYRVNASGEGLEPKVPGANGETVGADLRA
eukprot:4196704-Prymnesium_polylepis.1